MADGGWETGERKRVTSGCGLWPLASGL